MWQPSRPPKLPVSLSEITATLQAATGFSRSVGVSRISTWRSSTGAVHSMRKP